MFVSKVTYAGYMGLKQAQLQVRSRIKGMKSSLLHSLMDFFLGTNHSTNNLSQPFSDNVQLDKDVTVEIPCSHPFVYTR